MLRFSFIAAVVVMVFPFSIAITKLLLLLLNERKKLLWDQIGFNSTENLCRVLCVSSQLEDILMIETESGSIAEKC